MTGRPKGSLGFAAVAVAGLGVAAWTLPRLEFGDVDPLSAAIGFVSLLVGAAALVVAVRAWRGQQADREQVAAQLAAAVLDQEQRARKQLLGEAGRTIDVAFDFRPAAAHNAANAARRGRLADVAGYYRKLQPARMVITGPAGAGKTVLAVELVMALLETRQPDDPVPVRLSASSWNVGVDRPEQPADANERMQRWLTAHLVDVYQLSPRSADALVTAGLVLPVVDGLDELDATDEPDYASRAGDVLRVFNGYQRYREKAPLIVTCRAGHLEALAGDGLWVQDAARVELRPVTARQARAFITDKVTDIERWQSVLDRIDTDRDGPLAEALSTPWRLMLATIVYEQRSPDGRYERDAHELTSPVLKTADAIRDHLLAMFLPAAMSTLRDQPYDLDRTQRWLAVLADYLHRNATEKRSFGGRPLSGTDIVLHELWPLAGARRPRTIAIAFLFAPWLVALPIMLGNIAIGFSPGELLGAGVPALILVLSAVNAWSTPWPKARRLHPRRFRTPAGRRNIAGGLAIGLATGLTLGVAGGFFIGFPIGLTYGVTYGLAAGIAIGLADSVDASSSDPRSIVRDDLAAGVGMGLAIAVALAVSFSLRFGLAYGLAAGFAFGLSLTLTLELAGGSVGLRYLALLVCTRRRLPWRLGRFLAVCYEAGIVRVAGNAYQFRHRELQDHLARSAVRA